MGWPQVWGRRDPEDFLPEYRAGLCENCRMLGALGGGGYLPTRSGSAEFCSLCFGLEREVQRLEKKREQLASRVDRLRHALRERRRAAGRALGQEPGPSDPRRFCEACSMILTADRLPSARFCNDNCPFEPNEDQLDGNGDGVGNACSSE